MPPFAEVTFSAESLAVIGVVVSALVAGIMLMWRTDATRRDDQIADLRRQRDAAHQQRDDMVRVLWKLDLCDHIPDSVPHAAIPPPPPPGPTKG